MKIQDIKKSAVRTLVITLFLVMLSLLISYIMQDSPLSLKDVLFWVGSVPIAFVSASIFAPLSGRRRHKHKPPGTPPNQSPEQRGAAKSSAAAKPISSRIAWLSAGLLVWLVSYVM